MTSAKNEIKLNSLQFIDKQQLSTKVKTTAHTELAKMFADTSSTTIATKNKQKKLKEKLIDAAKSTKKLPIPKPNSNYGKLYQAELKINEATVTTTKKSVALNNELNIISKKNTEITPFVLNSAKLNAATTIISKKQQQVLTSIKLLSQKQALIKVFDNIRHEKQQKLSNAFGHTYILGSLLVLISSPIALWTDRRKKAVQSRKV